MIPTPSNANPYVLEAVDAFGSVHSVSAEARFQDDAMRKCKRYFRGKLKCRVRGILRRTGKPLRPDDPHFVSRERTEENFLEHAPVERVSEVRPRTLNSPAPSVPTLDRMGMRCGSLAGDGGRVLWKASLVPSGRHLGKGSE
jgi:hypothetical protein